MRKNYFKTLLGLIIILCVSTSKVSAQYTETWNNQVFKIDTLAGWLSYPQEVTYGPDDSLWVTECRGYRIRKINPRTKGMRTLIDLNSQKSYDRYASGQQPQGGLMGLALHPKLLTGMPYVYVAMVHAKFGNSGTPNNSQCSGTTGNHPCFFKTKILRYTYDLVTHSLNPVPDVVFDSLLGSNDHNSGRLAIGPDPANPTDTSKFKLYYTIGDMGAGQFNNQARTNNAQNVNVYEGKVLRLNLESDLDVPTITDPYKDWIPNDNPFSNGGNKTPVYSFGHRNPQGIVWGQVNGVWRLYSSEHGDKSDDEVNIIDPSTNYGWPKVAGMCDNNYSNADVPTNNDRLANQLVSTPEQTFCTNNSVREPIFALFNAGAANIQADGSNIFTWQTVAPSSIDFYGSFPHTIPGWQNSLLVTTLKYGIYRLKLKSTGDAIDSTVTAGITDTFPMFHGLRIRDMAISPSGDTMFLAIDSSGSTSGPTGGFNGGNIATSNAGRILRVTYLQTLALQDFPEGRPINTSKFVKVYPNPVSGTMYVEGIRGMAKPLRVQLYDAVGRIALDESTTKDNFTIDVRNLKPGVYIFKMFNRADADIVMKKVVIQ